MNPVLKDYLFALWVALAAPLILGGGQSYVQFRVMQSDLASVKTDIGKLAADIKSSNTEFRRDIKSDLAETRRELRDDIGQLSSVYQGVAVGLARVEARVLPAPNQQSTK